MSRLVATAAMTLTWGLTADLFPGSSGQPPAVVARTGDSATSDGTHTKSNLGANPSLGIAMAVCRAAALDSGLLLYAYARP